MIEKLEPMIDGVLLRAVKAAIALGGVDGLEALLSKQTKGWVLRDKRALRYMAYEQYLAENHSQAFASLEDLMATAGSLAECRRGNDWSKWALSGKTPVGGRIWV